MPEWEKKNLTLEEQMPQRASFDFRQMVRRDCFSNMNNVTVIQTDCERTERQRKDSTWNESFFGNHKVGSGKCFPLTSIGDGNCKKIKKDQPFVTATMTMMTRKMTKPSGNFCWVTLQRSCSCRVHTEQNCAWLQMYTKSPRDAKA